MIGLKFQDVPNIIPELVPKLIDLGDQDLANEYIELNSEVREVYEATMRLMEDASIPDFNDLHRDMERQVNLLKESLRLQIVLIDRYPDLALWVTKKMAQDQLDQLEGGDSVPWLSYLDEED